LAEIDVLHYQCCCPWPEGTTFEHEPRSAAGSPNPEALICAPELSLGIEVKSPNIRRHRNDLSAGWQAVSRALNPKKFEFTGLPRDNAVKDAIAGANEKFRSLRSTGRAFIGVLALVWDNMMHEPISAIINPASGLFTPNTFDPEKRTFDRVDAVVIVPHLHQLIEGPGNRKFIDGTTFEWRTADEFPFRPYIVNPASLRGQQGARAAEGIFGAHDHCVLHGAEYSPADSILWIDIQGGKGKGL